MRRLAFAVALLLLLISTAVAQTCITQVSGSPAQATLSWTFSQAAPPAGQATGFNVLRSVTGTGPFTVLNVSSIPLTTLSYVDTAVAAGVTYYYEVVATNSAGASPPSNIVCKAMLQVPPPNAPNVNITLLGTGTGTVKSSPSGIACPSICSAYFAPGTSVGLTEKQAPNSRFGGWSGGGCSGTGSYCVTVIPIGGETVVALFTHK